MSNQPLQQSYRKAFQDFSGGMNSFENQMVISQNQLSYSSNALTNWTGVIEAAPGYTLFGSPFPNNSDSWIRMLSKFRIGSSVNNLVCAAQDDGNTNSVYKVDFKQTLGDGNFSYIGHTVGTATFSSSSTSVTGSGTTWTTMLKAGDKIKAQADSDSAYVEIQTVNSNTSLTLVSNYSASHSGASYIARKILHKNFIPRSVSFDKKLIIQNGSEPMMSWDDTTLNIIQEGVSVDPGSTVPVASFICTYKNRVFVADASNLYWSHAFDETSWEATSFEPIYPNDSGSTVQIKAFADTILVFRDNGKIYQVQGNFDQDKYGSPSYIGQVDTPDNIGVIAGESVVIHDDGKLYFLASTGVYSIDSSLYFKKESWNINPNVYNLQFPLALNKSYIFNTGTQFDTGTYTGTTKVGSLPTVLGNVWTQQTYGDLYQGAPGTIATGNTGLFNTGSGVQYGFIVAYISAADQTKVNVYDYTFNSTGVHYTFQLQGVAYGLSFGSALGAPAIGSFQWNLIYLTNAGGGKTEVRCLELVYSSGVLTSSGDGVFTTVPTSEGPTITSLASASTQMGVVVCDTSHKVYDFRGNLVFTATGHIANCSATNNGSFGQSDLFFAISVVGSGGNFSKIVAFNNSSSPGVTWSQYGSSFIVTNATVNYNVGPVQAVVDENGHFLVGYIAPAASTVNPTYAAIADFTSPGSSRTIFSPSGLGGGYAGAASPMSPGYQRVNSQDYFFGILQDLGSGSQAQYYFEGQASATVSGYEYSSSGPTPGDQFFLVNTNPSGGSVGNLSLSAFQSSLNASNIVINIYSLKAEWQSPVESDSSLIGWGIFQTQNEVLAGNTITYEVATSTTITLPAPHSITNGQLISTGTTDIYFQASIIMVAYGLGQSTVGGIIANYVDTGVSPCLPAAIVFNNEMYITCANNGDTNNDLTLFLDRAGAWGQRNYPVSTLVNYNFSLYGGSSNNGNIYQLNSGFTANGSPYVLVMTSKEDVLGSLELQKDIYKIYVLFNVQPSGTFQFSYRVDNFLTPGGATWVTTTVDQTGNTPGQKGIAEIPYTGTPCRSIQFLVNSTINGTSSSIVGWVIVYGYLNLR